MRRLTLAIAICVLSVLGRAQSETSEVQVASLKQFIEVHKTDALSNGWQLGCIGFPTPECVAISFTYQSELSGTNSDAINEELVRRWPEVEALANRSGVTQAMMVAKGNKSTTPVEWQCGQSLLFVRSGGGEWFKQYVCQTNIPPISVKELQKAYDVQRAGGRGREGANRR